MNDICHLKVPWHEDWNSKEFALAIVGKVVEDSPGKWTLLLKIRGRNEDGKELLLCYNVPVNPFSSTHSGERTRPETWGMDQLGPGVWSLDPSVIIPGVIHAFVTLVDVPEPALWRIK